MVTLKTNFSFLKPWADNSSTNQYFMAGGWHTSCHPISKMHIVGEGPGEIPSAWKCLSSLIDSFLTDMKQLADTRRGAVSIPLLKSMSEASSVPFHTVIKLCYTRALEWSSLVPGPEVKSSSSEITNLTPFTVSYHLGGSSGIFWTRWEHSRALASLLSQYTYFLLYFTNFMVCLCEWITHPAWSKCWALLFGFKLPHNDRRQLPKGEPHWGFTPTCQCRETPNVPARGTARDGQSVWP